MKTTDPGHCYMIDDYPGDPDSTTNAMDSEQLVVFMHKVGDRYPGNQGEPYDGTNCQELLRVLIHRCLYLNEQIPCQETTDIISSLRNDLRSFETRAARIHGLKILSEILFRVDIENVPVCRRCGHVICRHSLKEKRDE